MSYKIDENVPIPRGGHDKTGLTDFLCQLQPGQSIFVADKTASTVQGTAQYAARKSGKKFAIRSEKSGARVWCIAIQDKPRSKT